MESHTVICKLTADAAAQDRFLWEAVQSGTVEVMFEDRGREFYVRSISFNEDLVPPPPATRAYRAYLRQPKPKFADISSEFELTVIEGRRKVKCLKIESPNVSQQPMVLEQIGGIDEQLAAFLGEDGAWQDRALGLTLTITIVELSRKELNNMKEWEA